MAQTRHIELLVFNKLIDLLVEFLKSLRINIIHQNLIPTATDMLEPLGTELLQNSYDLSQFLLRDLFQSLV
jgi:hypothetical protein